MQPPARRWHGNILSEHLHKVYERTVSVSGRLVFSFGMTPVNSHGRTCPVCFSFHPQLSWYQTSDTVTVTVKLANPESQSCEFYPDRVVYRSVRSRTRQRRAFIILTT